MHEKILTADQAKLLPLIKEFQREFYLVGGTAIALQLGHRRSIDFDLFKKNGINHKKILQKIQTVGAPYEILFQDGDQCHFIMYGVKITFFSYGYDIPHPLFFKKIISLPSILDLAAMKAFALGKRAKWKDYVDLYFIIKNHHTSEEISLRARELFNGSFSQKLFRQQLCYYQDVDYREDLEYLEPHYVSDKEIERYLTEVATRPL